MIIEGIRSELRKLNSTKYRL